MDSPNCPKCDTVLEDVRTAAVVTMMFGKPFTSRFHEYKCPKCNCEVTYDDEGEIIKQST